MLLAYALPPISSHGLKTTATAIRYRHSCTISAKTRIFVVPGGITAKTCRICLSCPEISIHDSIVRKILQCNSFIIAIFERLPPCRTWHRKNEFPVRSNGKSCWLHLAVRIPERQHVPVMDGNPPVGRNAGPVGSGAHGPFDAFDFDNAALPQAVQPDNLSAYSSSSIPIFNRINLLCIKILSVYIFRSFDNISLAVMFVESKAFG